MRDFFRVVTKPLLLTSGLLCNLATVTVGGLLVAWAVINLAIDKYLKGTRYYAISVIRKKEKMFGRGNTIAAIMSIGITETVYVYPPEYKIDYWILHAKRLFKLVCLEPYYEFRNMRLTKNFRAIGCYKECADNAVNPEVKKLFEFLAEYPNPTRFQDARSILGVKMPQNASERGLILAKIATIKNPPESIRNFGKYLEKEQKM